MSDFLRALHSGRVLLMDGAMGTELFRGGVSRDACLEEFNLTQPDLVKSVHRSYVEAGAEVLVTNTFQANPDHLERHHLRGKTLIVCETAAHLAREIATHHAVLADLGPLATDQREHLRSFFEGCVYADGILAETWADPRPFGLLRELNYPTLGYCLPLLVSFAFQRTPRGELRTFEDFQPERCAEIVTKYDGIALGVNCGRDIGRTEILEIIRRYRSVTDLPLFVRPNAGTPTEVDGNLVYPETPESMAAWLPELFEAGVVMVGGCCGTTPNHIAAFRKVVDEWNSRLPKSC